MDSGKSGNPTKEKVRAWLQERRHLRTPPAIPDIRRAIGWRIDGAYALGRCAQLGKLQRQRIVCERR